MIILSSCLTNIFTKYYTHFSKVRITDLLLGMVNLLDSVILFFVKSLNAQLSFWQELLCVLRFSPDLIGHGLIMSRA
jgi:hypothetical protein